MHACAHVHACVPECAGPLRTRMHTHTHTHTVFFLITPGWSWIRTICNGPKHTHMNGTLTPCEKTSGSNYLCHRYYCDVGTGMFFKKGKALTTSLRGTVRRRAVDRRLALHQGAVNEPAGRCPCPCRRRRACWSPAVHAGHPRCTSVIRPSADLHSALVPVTVPPRARRMAGLCWPYWPATLLCYSSFLS